ncbi:FAD-binding oxidoreductase [uncultured Arthrobacter sp.]|uniref:FAD-binding oxidoreductase n=1 Tax=uncultured Arthrobacter sp. TaxID=114050 RepID=UPI0025F6DC86|nr:FAD-dependent oxidoreductase [uncultured Arthrobacter sp.]
MTAEPNPAAPGPILAAAGESAYTDATASYNLAVEIRPQFAATATTVAEVQAILREAAAQDLSVRVHATGHGSGSVLPYGADDVLIRVRMEGGVAVDPDARTAVIPAGTPWGEVLAASAPHGLVPLHGSSPTVGAVGYLLRTGLSFYGRRYGLASNSLTSITLVTADGAVVTVDHDNDRELFDALRGGGGGFGVVVSVTVSLFAIDSVFTGAAFWPAAVAPFLLQAWEEWAATAPPEASTAFRIMNLPPLPGLPPALTAGPVVCIDGAVLGGEGRSGAEIAADLLEPLRRRVEPILDTWHPGVPTDVPATHMDPPDPAPFVGDHQMLKPLGAAGRQALLSIAGTAAGAHLTIVELRQLGGALAVPDPRGGIVNSLSGAYGSLSIGILAGPDAAEGVEAGLAALRAVLEPWDTGLTAPSFVDRFDGPQRSFDASVAEQVEAVRRRVDPQGMFGRDASYAVPAGSRR